MQIDLKDVELRALWHVLNDHKYMVKALMMDAEISAEVKEAEVGKHKAAQKVLRKLYAAYKVQSPRRPAKLPTQPSTDGGANG